MYATKATIVGLVAHINAQPARREVDHSSWETCAVGNYCREVFGQSPHIGFRPTYVEDGSLLSDLWKEAGSYAPGVCSFVREIDHESLIDVLQIAGAKGWDTYGKLRNGLSKKFPELGFMPVEPTWLTKLKSWFDHQWIELVPA